MFFTKSIFWDSLGRAPWRKNNFEKAHKKQYSKTLWEGPLKKSKKPLEKQKNKKHKKKKQYCILRLFGEGGPLKK